LPKWKCSAEDIHDICERYRQGESMQSLAVRYHRGTIKPIKRILEQSGVELRTNDEAIHKYHCNYHYFDQIDTPNKAYILGFLYADGCNYMNDKSATYHWQIELQRQDADILRDMMAEIEYDGKLREVTHHYTDRPDTESVMFYVCNHHMCDALNRAGVHPHKTYTTTWPEWLPDHLVPHFIRGLLDGDGCITTHKNTSIAGTRGLIEPMQKVIERLIGITMSLYQFSNPGGTVDCRISGSSAKRFLDWIYADADLKLKRKYDRYVSMWKNSNVKATKVEKSVCMAQGQILNA